MKTLNRKKRQKFKKGRPLKINVDRYPSGRIVNAQRGEKPEQVRAVVLKQRAKNIHIPANLQDTPEAGFELGVLSITTDDGRRITRRQFKAGLEWARRRFSYFMVNGLQKPQPSSAGFLSHLNGIPCYPDFDEEKTDEILRNHADVFHPVLQADPTFGFFRSLERVCVENRQISDNEIGNLRCGLNLVARVCGLTEE